MQQHTLNLFKILLDKKPVGLESAVTKEGQEKYDTLLNTDAQVEEIEREMISYGKKIWQYFQAELSFMESYGEEKRKELFERDKWICHYCGEKVTEENATLDHLTPQCKGGKHTKSNLKTSCLVCNSIKSGKTYEEAAPFLLKSIQERRTRSHK